MKTLQEFSRILEKEFSSENLRNMAPGLIFKEFEQRLLIAKEVNLLILSCDNNDALDNWLNKKVRRKLFDCL